MHESAPENPPVVEEVVDKAAAGEAGQLIEKQPGAARGADRVFFLLADATEGPTAPVDPEVATRRADRAMARLLRPMEREAPARSAAAPARSRRR